MMRVSHPEHRDLIRSLGLEGEVDRAARRLHRELFRFFADLGGAAVARQVLDRYNWAAIVAPAVVWNHPSERKPADREWILALTRSEFRNAEGPEEWRSVEIVLRHLEQLMPLPEEVTR